MESSRFFLDALANALKPAPGNHSGTYLTAQANIVRSFGKGSSDWNPHGWGRHQRKRLQAAGREQRQSLHPQTQSKIYHSQI